MWSCPNCESWIIASRICPNCGAWVGDDSADEQDSDHPVELAIMGDTLLSCSGRKAKVVVPAGVKELEEYSFYNDTALQEIELPEDLTMILKCFQLDLLHTGGVHSIAGDSAARQTEETWPRCILWL